MWRGLDAPRMEIAHADASGDSLSARGTQIGAPYELRYALEGPLLRLEVVGGPEREVVLGGADFFDLEFSPLFNSLPVLRHDLHRRGRPHDFVMAFVSVPSLEVTRSEQRYEPIGPGRVRYLAGSFSAGLELDHEGFVVRYPGLAERVHPPLDQTLLF